jgi:branched-chain amino acid transport system ATP-binding protein
VTVPPALELAGVSKVFGGLTAVADVALTVRPGERRAIIGPNGAGKTTLFNVISGQLAPTTGRILLFGHDVTRLPAFRRAALGLARTFQITNLFPTLTVRENVLLAVQALERTKLVMFRSIRAYGHLYERTADLLDAVGLAGKDDVVVKTLSHGEQRQLEIALALAGRPRLLLLDEPAAGLSSAEAQMLVGMLKRMDSGITMLIIEHDMDIAFGLAERVTVLHNGRVIADGAGEAVRANPLVAEIYLGTDEPDRAPDRGAPRVPRGAPNEGEHGRRPEPPVGH